MDWTHIRYGLSFVQHLIATIGVLIILFGVGLGLVKFVFFLMHRETKESQINVIRLTLGRFIILGLEFIVAADLIGSISTPDYYELGTLAIIVAIRTLLSFSLNKEMMEIRKEERS